MDINELNSYERGWTDFMVDIWHERQVMLQINDTGALRSSVSGSISGAEGQRQITHRFLLYGIYVSAGVGRGYTHGNGGDLEFLDPQYRKEHRLDRPRKKGPAWGGGYTSGKPRKPRDWFVRKYLYSMHRLMDKEAAFYGEAYQGTLIEAFATMFENGKAVSTSTAKTVAQL